MAPDPSTVSCDLIDTVPKLALLQTALNAAERVAIDTETPIAGPHRQQLRVMSVATRDRDGHEQAFVVDARDVDATLLAPILDGVTADAWNANFDARVLDAAVWQSQDTTPGLRWWDAQLADALLFQGRSGFTWFHGLAWATQNYLGLEAEGKGTVQLSYTAFDDLTDEQVRYSAADAVETLWVGDAIRRELQLAGLEQIAEIEMEARPFLDRMERAGLPFDWAGWEQELVEIEAQNRQVLGRLSGLTGGGQGTLFDDVVEPNWNPASDRQVREALNTFASTEVRSWATVRLSEDRLLKGTDSVTASVLREIGGPLSEAILEFRNHTKILSTYGESIREHIRDDGRMHPQYLQVVGTNTGRLASRNPNAQNFSPRMHPHVRNPDADRVFVYADLSQAELRFLAQVSNDEPLRAAFERGVDVHVSTAASMFGFDPESLQATDPDRFKHLRQIAKALNFGIAYGTGAAALSRSLTAEGSPTSVDDAAKLLDQYRATYPGTAAWADERIAEIAALKDQAEAIDWRSTMKLARAFGAVSSTRREFRKREGRWPTPEEILDRHPDRLLSDNGQLLERIRWVMDYSAPVALLPGGEPFTFSCRTLAGRRQQFNLHLDRLFLSVVLNAVQSADRDLVEVRKKFEREFSVFLWRPEPKMTTGELERQFEDRNLRRAYVEAIAAGIGKHGADALLVKAARERVGAMVNAWRNAPIQGGVADIMLVAYADLDTRLRQFPDALPVQTVHDSVVIECSQSSADAVAVEVRGALEEATRRFCPDVVPKADVDIRRSLAEADVLRSL